jgi:hypothetical protein
MIVKYIAIRATISIAILSAVVLGLSLWAGAQSSPAKTEGAMGAHHSPTLSATLVDPETKAQKHEATVEAKVAGVQIVDPAKVNEQPAPSQGHLHYQLDSGPVIATTATKLSFHELSAGEHKITVMLAANDHTALGPQKTLTVTIPPGSEGRAQRR